MTEKKVSLGICAMAKKVNSNHMQQILNGLSQFDEFELIIFTEDIIFNKDISKWPIVDAMLVFFSGGFPYNKVLKYIHLRKPFLINDFEMQRVFWDRREVIKILKENNIKTPNNIIIEGSDVINNDHENSQSILNKSFEIEEIIKEYEEKYSIETEILKGENKNKDKVSLSIEEEEKNITYIEGLEEYDDFIKYKGVKMYKPFVEKPCNGDDHFVYIYYPLSHGGGHRRLFRKTKNLCSLYYPEQNKIRRDKSYVYEEFLQTDGFDIKVYTVGPDYAHAEARKSPCLDGKVKRMNDGKEIRYPVNLTPEEKEFARKIVLIFKQNICGFDILRANGHSYVCDVNGLSFVKSNKKYYEDCSILIRKIILQKVNNEMYLKKPICLRKISMQHQEMQISNKISGNKTNEELRSVVAVFRHADRSPKQRMRFEVDDPLILSLFDKNNIKEEKDIQDITLKKPEELTQVLNIVKTILQNKGIDETSLSDSTDDYYIKLFQIKLVLEKNPNYEGMTRKILMTPMKWEKKDEKIIIIRALFSIKWGGNITHSGIEQAMLMGNTFRGQLYSSSLESEEDLLTLHSTYRHDLKCYSSDVGRCLKTAASFLKGLLGLEGNLIPIISSMVRRDHAVSELLDMSNTIYETKPFRKKVKDNLDQIINYKGKLADNFESYINESNCNLTESKEQSQPRLKLMTFIDNAYEQMKRVHNLMGEMIEYLKTKLSITELESESSSFYIKNAGSILSRATNMSEIRNSKRNKNHLLSLNDKSSSSTKETKLDKSEMDCEEEKIVLIFKRYAKLYQSFYIKDKNKFNSSKISLIYYNIKYDILHNKKLLNQKAFELFSVVQSLEFFSIPLKYGITINEKFLICFGMISPLLDKIIKDLNWWNKDYAPLDELQKIENSYSGLDQFKLNINDMKSSWRHIKTRFYFTCKGHLLSLFQTLFYSLYMHLGDEEKEKMNEVWKIFNLDFCSHIVFRLFENFNVNVDDPKRFRIEILFSPGANKDPSSANKKHFLPVSPWIVVNDNLEIGELANAFDFIKKQVCKKEK